MTDNSDTRMHQIGYRAPADVPEPDQLVLLEFVSGGRVAIITLNRPHADNAVTTELAATLAHGRSDLGGLDRVGGHDQPGGCRTSGLDYPCRGACCGAC